MMEFNGVRSSCVMLKKKLRCTCDIWITTLALCSSHLDEAMDRGYHQCVRELSKDVVEEVQLGALQSMTPHSVRK